MTSLKGTTGAKYTLSEPCHWPHEINFSNWTVTFLPGSNAIQAVARVEIDPAMLPRESYRAVQKALDLMSIGGGGHFEITDPWDARILWWTVDDRLHLRVSDDVWMPRIPYTILVGPANTEPADMRDVTKSPRWHEAFRYFRLSQTAPDVFSAFSMAYLCFEALLESQEPMRGDEREKKWLRRAIRSATTSYSLKAQVKLGSDRAIEDFLAEVYDKIRCGVFHAKASKGPTLPLDTTDAPAVAAALRLLMEHVLELARDWTDWAAEARPQMDHELLETGEWLRSAPTVVLGQAAGNTNPSSTSIRAQTQPNADISLPSVPAFTARIDVDEKVAALLNVSSIITEFHDGGLAIGDLGIGFLLDDVETITIDLAMRFGFSQMVRTLHLERSAL